MKKHQVILLIASICLLGGTILNLLNRFIALRPIVYFMTIPLLLGAIVLYGISYYLYKKSG